MAEVTMTAAQGSEKLVANLAITTFQAAPCATETQMIQDTGPSATRIQTDLRPFLTRFQEHASIEMPAKNMAERTTTAAQGSEKRHARLATDTFLAAKSVQAPNTMIQDITLSALEILERGTAEV